MLTGFSLVFAVIIAILSLFLGAMWSSRSPINIVAKLGNFVVAGASVFVLSHYSRFPVVFLVLVGLWAGAGAVVWKTNTVLNVTLKWVLSATAITLGLLAALGTNV